jgi:hypothetical protein
MGKFVFLLALLTCASELPAQPTAHAVESIPIPESALRLARLIYPQDKVLEVRIKLYDAGVAASLKDDPGKAAWFSKYPGLLDIGISAGRAVLEKHIIASAPQRQDGFARFYAKNFSPAEIDQLISFYSSPTGSKLISGMYAGTNAAQMVAAIGPSADEHLTPEQTRDVQQIARAQVRAQYSADDVKALAAFAASPVHAKLGQLRSAFSALVASTEADPTLETDINKAIEASIIDYLAKHDGNRAK